MTSHAEERRKHARVPYLAVLELYPPGSVVSRGRGAVTDLSLGGAALESKAQFQEGELVSFHIEVVKGDKLAMTGRVIRRQVVAGAFHYGLEFTELGFFEKRKMRDMLESRLARMKMSAKLLDGKAVSKRLMGEVAIDVERLRQAGTPPTLAAVLVGEDEASHAYVRQKQLACSEVGLQFAIKTFSAGVSEAALLEALTTLNADPSIHAILVQLPLPAPLSPDRVASAISPEKDADGFHPANLGRLMACRTLAEMDRLRLPLPCTPAGILRLLREYQIPVGGAQAVIVGRSQTVGKPLAHLLLALNATVTICHSRTPNLGEYTRRADLLVAAVGRARLIKADMVKPGAVVVDVGITREGGRLVGDVDTQAVAEKVRAITPVPGGVGPMTVTMVLANTVLLAKRQVGLT